MSGLNGNSQSKIVSTMVFAFQVTYVLNDYADSVITLNVHGQSREGHHGRTEEGYNCFTLVTL